jgi:hypothetical protein
MKRLLVSVFALSLAAPVWAQDGEPDSDALPTDIAAAENCDADSDDVGNCEAQSVDGNEAGDGPSEDAISDLLELLDDADDASVSAPAATDPCDPDPDGTDLVGCDDDASSSDDETAESSDGADLESLLRLDSPDDDEGETTSEDSALDETSADDAVSEDAPNDADNSDDAGDASDEAAEPDPTDEAADDAQLDDETSGRDQSDSETADEVSDLSEESNANDDATSDGSDETEALDEPEEPDESDVDSVGSAAETADEVSEGHNVELTTSTPFLTSDGYIALRAESRGEQLEMVWSIRRETSAGEPVGETETRTLYMAPDFIRDESVEGVSVFDFLTDRHLEIDPAAETYTNTAFAAEVRRRLDTYLGLSQGGRLEDIPIGPGRSFDRFWLEAAMGIRREPVTLTRELDGGDLSVARTGGLVLLTARFDIADTETPDDEAGETDTETAPEESEADALRRAATPIDLSSGESVVFDPSQAALPINLNLGGSRINYPDAAPEAQAQAELFRRWMRHALPIHPDVLSALEGAPHIPTAFSYYIISPESPAGRREIWTLESLEATETGLRLEAGLAPRFGGPDWINDSVMPTAITTRDSETAPDIDAMLEEIEQRRDADDNIGAYLVSLQEQHHFGPCPTLAEAELRAVCSATSSVVASGLGDPGFEALFGVLSGPSPSGDETLIETLQPYLGDDDYAGAAARILTAKALLRWAARDPDNVPDDASPFDLFAEAIEIDPLAGAAWWETGNALLVQRDPLGAWTVFDAGRAILPDGMIQVIALEDRLRVLAPEFFLPR